jgi:hypothetical protein
VIWLLALALAPAVICAGLALLTGIGTFWVAAAVWAISGPLFFA